MCYWSLVFIIFLYSHLVNLTFVLLTDPSFIPQLQFICCSSTSFNSLFFLCLTLSSCPFSFFALSLSRLHRGHMSTMFWVLAKHLASKPIHPAGQYVCYYNVCTQSTLVTACLSCQIQITGQRESELRGSSKNLISLALFCLQDIVVGEKNITSLIVWADNIKSGEDFFSTFYWVETGKRQTGNRGEGRIRRATKAGIKPATVASMQHAL